LTVRRLALFGGPAIALLVGAAMRGAGLSEEASWTAAITTLCAAWWVLEPIPMPVTALIPFAALPLTGVVAHGLISNAYGHTLVLLMLAGSMIGMALERAGAHRRLALGMVTLVGGVSARRLVWGFLFAAALLSMWMSNTATVVMLLPVVIAVLEYHRDDAIRLSVPLLLAIAYGGAIGGTATPIGTPPNLILLSQYELATGTEVSFAEWMRIGVPLVALMLPVVGIWLTRGIGGVGAAALPELGSWRSDERRVVLVFAITALAWMTRSDPYGGWSEALGVSGTAGDSSVAIAAVIVLFLVPRGGGDGGALLDWESAARIPWGVFIMIGGGMAIGQAFQTSGLGRVLGDALVPLTTLPTWAMVGIVALLATFITEITSNTAVANVMMPVLAGTGLAAGMDPWWLMVPATIGLNWAFMLPVATAPNAFVYGTGRITARQMAREGLALNLMGCVIITVMSLWLLV
jgi:sodium-dependent dicarboxylate transporter 2/3/5